MGPTQPDGWSARGGQTQSPFGPGLNVGSSSTGCATGLAAGFCAAVVAEETCSSIVSTINLYRHPSDVQLNTSVVRPTVKVFTVSSRRLMSYPRKERSH